MIVPQARALSTLKYLAAGTYPLGMTHSLLNLAVPLVAV